MFAGTAMLVGQQPALHEDMQLDRQVCDWPPANRAGDFDPAVLVDEQADRSVRVYAYWGMMGGDRWAEGSIPGDMHTIIDGQTRKPDRNGVAPHSRRPRQGDVCVRSVVRPQGGHGQVLRLHLFSPSNA